VTISRGEVVNEEGNFTGKRGRGQFIKGKAFQSKRPEL
jgi:hypothetical protein